MGFVTTHVLDTARGVPAVGVPLRLSRIVGAGDGEMRRPVCETRTNADGRCEAPILSESEFALGLYEIAFDAGAYFAAHGVAGGFLSVVTVRFGVTADSHYHVPLLLSPFGYSTYRGS